MGRFLAMVFGALGAVAFSQAPEFTQQYMQNLAGRVAALTEVVERFDEDAARSNLTRGQAMQLCLADDQPEGTMSCLGRAGDIQAYEEYRAQFTAINEAGEWQKPIFLARNYDKSIFDDTRQNYKPAVPTTLAGGGYAAAGFALFWGIAATVFGFIGGLFGRDRY